MVSGTCAWCDKRIRHRSHGRSKNGLLYLLDTNEISKVIKSEHKRAHESCRMKLVHERPHRNQSLLKLQIIDATKQRQVKLKLQPKRTVRSSLRSPLVATVTAAAATPILMRSSVTQQKPSSIQPQHSRSRGRLVCTHEYNGKGNNQANHAHIWLSVVVFVCSFNSMPLQLVDYESIVCSILL